MNSLWRRLDGGGRSDLGGQQRSSIDHDDVIALVGQLDAGQLARITLGVNADDGEGPLEAGMPLHEALGSLDGCHTDAIAHIEHVPISLRLDERFERTDYSIII